MVNTGYLNTLLLILREAYTYHTNARPNLKPPDVIGPGETSLFTLLARIALLSPALFEQAVSASLPAPHPEPLSWLISEWLTHFDAIGDVLRKKLQALALTNLLSHPPTQAILYTNLQSLMSMWTDIITELNDATDYIDQPYEPQEQDHNPLNNHPNPNHSEPQNLTTATNPNQPLLQGDYLYTNNPSQTPDWPDMTPEDTRKRALSTVDPIYTVHIRVFVAERFAACVKVWSTNPNPTTRPSQFTSNNRDIGIEDNGDSGNGSGPEWLAHVDPAVLRAFADLKLDLA
jgi:hypothetical protein